MKRFIISVLCASGMLAMNAADFFSTDVSPDFMTFGARIGVNTSNRVIDKKSMPLVYNHQNWGTGFDLGVVANFNFRDYLTLQPGLFFESRNGSYTFMGQGYQIDADGSYSQVAQAGDRHSFNFTVPVMAVIGFNVTDDVRWTVEAGPYLAFVLSSKLKNKSLISPSDDAAQSIFASKPASFDFGFKLGTGIKVLQHYYIGAHYMAGCIDAWKNHKLPDNRHINYGGVTKGWVFTLGYNF